MKLKKGPKTGEEVNDIMEQLRLDYAKWRKEKKDSKSGFFVIYNDLFTGGKLRDIKGNALKLFIYLGIHANNESGECWHSVEKISSYFGMDTRTVNRALKDLEDTELIIRIQKGFKRVANTFLKPY